MPPATPIFLTVLALQICRVISILVVDKEVIFWLQVIESQMIRRWPH